MNINKPQILTRTKAGMCSWQIARMMQATWCFSFVKGRLKGRLHESEIQWNMRVEKFLWGLSDDTLPYWEQGVVVCRLQDSTQWSPKHLRPWCEPGLFQPPFRCLGIVLNHVEAVEVSFPRLQWVNTAWFPTLMGALEEFVLVWALLKAGNVLSIWRGHGMISQPRPPVRWWWEPWGREKRIRPTDCALS